MPEHDASDQDSDERNDELTEQLLIGAQSEIALFDHLDVVVCKAEQKMPEEDEEREQRRHRQRSKEKRRRRYGKHNHHAAHRRRAALLLVTRGALGTDALSVFQAMQKRKEIHAAEKHNRQRCHDRQQDAQLRCNRIQYIIHQCPAFSPVSRAITCSIRMPREPLNRTVSPSERILRSS